MELDEINPIDSFLITLTLAVRNSRLRPHPRPNAVTRRRTSTEDGLAIARFMDILDSFAESTPASLVQVRPIVEQAAQLIREWDFLGAYRLLDTLKEYCPSGGHAGDFAASTAQPD